FVYLKKEHLLMNNIDIMYNDKTYYENEFRRIQESRRNPAPGTESERFWRMDKILSDSDKQYLGRIFSGFLGERSNEPEGSQCCSRGDDWRADLIAKGNTFTILEVGSLLFHDIFEINRSYLRYGELVVLHDDYSDCKCFLTSDGLAGFAIDPDGNLISVFSQYGRLKPGFLHAIKDFVIEQGATHCDCYDSKLQPLPSIYEKTLGWQVASRMKYNMAFDHDSIAANHDKPDIAFMVWSRRKIEKHEYDENEYEQASLWQKAAILKSKAEDADFKNLYYSFLNCGNIEISNEEVSLITLYGTLSKEEKNIVGSSLSYLESLVQILQSKTILPSLRLREQKSNIMDKQADYSNNLNTCQARYPGTNNKIWCNLPYTIIDIKFSTPPYAGGKPLNECPGWTELNADWGHIDSITIKDGMGNEHIFSGNQIDDKNRIVFELEDMTVKYSIETGGVEFFPHPKKDKTEVQQKGQMIQQAVHKGKGI
ncbi:MAG: hypothetical protein KBT06_07485, partial [Prevotellaceae bacterium]|nr:hypothetical protein [Candidatus Colivivens equi]